MIEIKITKALPHKHVSCVVLRAEFMHGDADIDTVVRLKADKDDQEGLAEIKRVSDYYASISARPLGDRRPSAVLPDLGICQDLAEQMLPWDKTQAEIGVYDNRAELTGYALRYYNAHGAPNDIVLQEVP